jgi:hypothetical protein
MTDLRISSFSVYIHSTLPLPQAPLPSPVRVIDYVPISLERYEKLIYLEKNVSSIIHLAVAIDASGINASG